MYQKSTLAFVAQHRQIVRVELQQQLWLRWHHRRMRQPLTAAHILGDQLRCERIPIPNAHILRSARQPKEIDAKLNALIGVRLNQPESPTRTALCRRGDQTPCLRDGQMHDASAAAVRTDFRTHLRTIGGQLADRAAATVAIVAVHTLPGAGHGTAALSRLDRIALRDLGGGKEGEEM